MADGDAGPRPERQILAHPVVLGHVDRDGVGARREARPDAGVADGQPADAARGRQVALHERRRQRERAGQVVEAVAGDVGGQERAAVHLEGQQIADGVRVLGAVEAVGRHPARLGPVRGRAVERRLEPAAEVLGLARRRPGPPRGRHHAPAQLLDHRLPARGRGADVRRVEPVERQPAGVEPLVVAGDAVAVQQRPLGRGRRRGRHGALRGAGTRAGRDGGLQTEAPEAGQHQPAAARDDPAHGLPHPSGAARPRGGVTAPPVCPRGRCRAAEAPRCRDRTGCRA